MQRNELVNLANNLGFDPTTIANDSKLEAHLMYLQTNASTMAGTLAAGTVTASGVAVAAETITIGSKTYTWRTALTGVKATSTLTNATSFSAGETITIDGRTYTMVVTPVKQDDIAIGANVAASLDNIKQAINQGDTAWPSTPTNEGRGTNWGYDTQRHHSVIATTNGATTQVIEAKDFGTAANEYLTSETCATGSWTSTVMAGGVANVLNEIVIGAAATNSLDNLKSAINNTAGEGTVYSTGTKAHPEVTAGAKDATTLVVTARDFAVGEDIATTETMTNWAWGATTLASGVADQNAVSATAVAQTGKGQNANV